MIYLYATLNGDQTTKKRVAESLEAGGLTGSAELHSIETGEPGPRPQLFFSPKIVALFYKN